MKDKRQGEKYTRQMGKREWQQGNMGINLFKDLVW
jgi:hypothetical protein